LGPLVAGVLFDLSGNYTIAWALAAFVALLALLLVVLARKPSLPVQLREAAGTIAIP
jgi:cyanate permease